MLPQRSDTHPPCLQQLTQPHPRPLPPILALFPSPPHASPLLLLPSAGRGTRVRDGEGEWGTIGWRWRGRVRAQSSVLVGRCLVLFLLLIGCQQYLDRARLFTGGHRRRRVSVSQQHEKEKEKEKNKNRTALTSGELLHRGKVTTAYQDKQADAHKQTHTHNTSSLTYRTNSYKHTMTQPCASIALCMGFHSHAVYESGRSSAALTDRSRTQLSDLNIRSSNNQRFDLNLIL